jgi:methylated-DNA-[protein]-cysteine S-methyltransferase
MISPENTVTDSIIIREYKCPAGALLLGSYKGELCLCDWKYRKMRETIDRRIQKILQADYIEGNSAVIKETEKQLNEYFEKEREVFDIPMLPAGSDFQILVWDELMKVPYGSTATYMELALRINKKEAIRAVASANGANALSILIPCHRIIGSSGELVGYAGGLNAKEKLLELESSSPEQYNLFD